MILPGVPYLLLAAFVAGAFSTYKVMDWRHDAELVRELKVAQVLQKETFKTVIKTETVVQEKIRVIREKGQEVIREVPKIITKEVEGACPTGLPLGFIRVLDTTAIGRTPGPPTLTDAAPSGVTLTRASEIVSINYTEYNVLAEQVKGWQSFYADLRKTVNLQCHSRK